jgi:hypothetical protein
MAEPGGEKEHGGDDCWQLMQESLLVVLVGSRTGATLRRFSLRVEENYVDFRLSLALSCGSSKLDAA